MSLVLLVPLIISAAWADAAGQASLELIPEPIVTRQTVFTIPFRIDGGQEQGKDPSEVQLYTSTDRGQTWRLYSKVGPNQGYFLFRAMGDGEFWFCVRTMDRHGTIRPEVNRPELRVLVDTAPPRLEVRARRGPAGQVITQWDVRDAKIRPENVSIQYRLATDQPWQAVAVNQQNYAVREEGQTGEVSWWPNTTSGMVQIRVEVADAAGNPSVYHAQVNLDSLSDTDAAVARAKPEADKRPTASVTSPPPAAETGPWRPATPAQRPADQRQAEHWPADIKPTDNALRPPVSNTFQTGVHTPSTSARSESRPFGDSTAPVTQESYRPVPPATSVTPGPAGPAPTAGTIPSRPSGSPMAAGFNPAIRNQYLPPADLRPERPTPYPAGVQPHMLNVRAFEVEYDVSAVGPWGIGRVELWGTSDGGQTWKSFGVDEDKKSPISVTLSQEGLYGFRVAVQSTAGLGGEAPRPGDPPQIWVGADWTKPQGRIVEARQGLGEAAAQLSIEWEASDGQLAERPVDLYWAESKQGPWNLIAKGLPANGRHYWSIDNRLTDRVYLRLEVADASSNRGQFDMPEPVMLQRFVPAVQIRDIRPLPAKP